jgi:hypothetical protein
MLLQLLKNPVFLTKGMGIATFLADSHWEILLKDVGQPMGTIKRGQESRWETSKGYWKASGQFLKG